MTEQWYSEVEKYDFGRGEFKQGLSIFRKHPVYCVLFLEPTCFCFCGRYGTLHASRVEGKSGDRRREELRSRQPRLRRLQLFPGRKLPRTVQRERLSRLTLLCDVDHVIHVQYVLLKNIE